MITPNQISVISGGVPAGSSSGRIFSATEMERARPVAVLGYEVADKLFAGADPLGKDVKIDEVTYGVVGVAKEQGSVLGVSQDKVVAVPISSYQKQFGREGSIEVPMEAVSDDAAAFLKDEEASKPGSGGSCALLTTPTEVRSSPVTFRVFDGTVPL